MTNKRKLKDELWLLEEKYRLLCQLSLAIGIRCEELPEDIISEFCADIRKKIYEAENG